MKNRPIPPIISRARALAALALLLAGGGRAAEAFPVTPSANGRYLVDENGAPYPILGRTAWFVISVSEPDIAQFLDDTVAHGYNAIEMHVIDHDPQANHPPSNGNGNLPFTLDVDGRTWTGSTNPGPDFTKPNETYWLFVDRLLAACEARGILVFMFPAYTGFDGGNQGWMGEMVMNGAARMQDYGTWIATRYRNQKNLVWMMGGDFGTGTHLFSDAQRSVDSALIVGLKSVAGQSAMFAAEWAGGSICSTQTDLRGNCTMESAYSWDAVVTWARNGYAASPVKPAFLLEEPYDEEDASQPPPYNRNPTYSTPPVRRYQWWGWLSTIGGYVNGNGYVWTFNPGWKDHLDTPATQDMGRLNAFIRSIPWYNLVPSGLGGMRNLVVAGGSDPGGTDYVAAAATPDGSLLVAYRPPDHRGSFSIDMSALAGSAHARWFDPTSAAYTEIGTGLPSSGSRAFTPPAANAGGRSDWVLVLDTGGVVVPVPDARPPAPPDARPPGTPDARPPVTPDARPPGTPDARPMLPLPDAAPGTPDAPPGGGGGGITDAGVGLADAGLPAGAPAAADTALSGGCSVGDSAAGLGRAVLAVLLATAAALRRRRRKPTR